MNEIEPRLAALERSLAALAELLRQHIATDSLALEHRLSDLAIAAAGLSAAPSPPRSVQ